jgi:hypothetical protein
MASELYSPSNAHQGSVNSRTSKMLSRFVSLRQTWRESRLRIVVHEIYSLPRRIRAILNTPSLWRGVEISHGMLADGTETFHQENTFQRACNENISRQQSENHWAGHLDLQMAARAFQQGAQWAYRNFCNRTRNGES